MRHFENWQTLNKLLADGSLSFIDLAFAKSVLKKLNSTSEEHASLLAVLFAMSRLGHLMLDVEILATSLKPLELQDNNKLIQLIISGAQTFPPEGITHSPKERPNAWIFCSSTYFYLQKNWVYESEILAHVHRLNTNSVAIPLSLRVLDSSLNHAQKKSCGKRDSLFPIPANGRPRNGQNIYRSRTCQNLFKCIT